MEVNSSIVKKMRKQAVKSVMDIVILAELKNVKMSGYDVISYIHETFGVLLSSGTVYSHIYSMERDGLIKGDWDTKKRVYNITEKGQQSLKTISENNVEMLSVLQKVLDH